MKFSVLTALAAGAALSTHISATPIRVVVVTNEIHSSPPANFRFGHALAPPDVPTKISIASVGPKPACRGARFRQKAIDLSNTIRKALGFPLIDAPVPVPAVVAPPHIEQGRVRILPFIGTPNTFVEVKDKDKDNKLYIAHSHMGFTQRLASKPFIHRLHIALMALGPWEGRAVAFVLGCGIGVLLRMFWVLAVVTYRLFTGPRADENEYAEILFVGEVVEPESVRADADAPPTYTYSDEKAGASKAQQGQNE